ncbi:MAG: DUF4386 domain-containing protein [Steroidobacteraceae bacterium]
MSSYAMTGRLAGLVYLGVVVTGMFTLAYSPARLIVEGDALATLASIVRHEALFRASAAAGVTMCLFFLVLPVVLFILLERHGRAAATLMVVFVVASVPIALLAIGNHLDIIALVFEPAAGAVPSPDAVAVHLHAYDRGMSLASIFWGLWLAPLGLLILKSGAIPRSLGVLLVIGCVGYLANFFGPLLFPGYGELPFRSFISIPGSIGEIGTCLWLVVKGAREVPPLRAG